MFKSKREKQLIAEMASTMRDHAVGIMKLSEEERMNHAMRFMNLFKEMVKFAGAETVNLALLQNALKVLRKSVTADELAWMTMVVNTIDALIREELGKRFEKRLP